MIKSLIIIGSLSCNPANVFWDSSEGLNKKDLDHVMRLRKRCGKGKLKDSPCLLYVRKKGELNYHVICTFKPRAKS